MRKQFLSALALVFIVLACAGEASALVQRTFVSGLGLDTNPCSREQPCRTFAAAIAQTQAGGEVLALDTAGYGPVTVTKAISLISPPGVYAGITTTSFATPAAITVSAGAGDVVVLKGLSLTGLNIGSNGVIFTSGKALRVEGLTISGFGNGILFLPAATARLTVTDSVIRDNGASGVHVIGAASQTARVTIERTRLAGNFTGVGADTNSRVTVRDSVAAGNGSTGFLGVVATATLNLENCLANDNGTGIHANGALVRAAGVTVTDNAVGLGAAGGGSILSRGNNTVEGNDFNGTFTSTFAPK